MNKALLLSALISLQCVAGSGSGKVTRIYTHTGDFVLFATETHSHGADKDTCIGAENEWGFSLKTETGKAMYSQLLAAASQGKQVNVSGANDCADFPSRERPAVIFVDY